MPPADQGIDRQRYTLIPRTLIFLTRTDEVLLIKGAPDKRLWAGMYNGVGGHVERGEDVLSAAFRELKEETGYSGVELWLCGTVIVDVESNLGVGIYIFRGEAAGKQPINSAEGDLVWVPRSAVFDLPLVEDLHVLLPRVLAAQRGEPSFAAHIAYDSTGKLTIEFGG
jgi:8-oxo-dGTP diphosphatase